MQALDSPPSDAAFYVYRGSGGSRKLLPASPSTVSSKFASESQSEWERERERGREREFGVHTGAKKDRKR